MSLIKSVLTLKRRELTLFNSRWRNIPLSSSQERLYPNKLFGTLNGEEITDAKLIQELITIFPASLHPFSVELSELSVKQYRLATVKTLELKLEQGYSFVISLDCVRYTKIGDALSVSCTAELSAPLFNLPKLSNRGTFNASGSEKVFVSQLVRVPGVRVSAKASSVEVCLLTPWARALTVSANTAGVWLATGSKTKANYFQSLLRLGIGHDHILKSLFDTAVLIRYKLEWKQLVWQQTQFDVSPISYGSRRRLRATPEFSAARGNGVLIKPAVSYNGSVVLDVGSVFCFDYDITGPVSVAYNCEGADLVLADKNCSNTGHISSLGLALVDFNQAGRIMFNSITNQQWGSDTLSKRDLVFLWKRLVSRDFYKIARDADVRITKGCGDVVLERVLFELKRSLKASIDSIQGLSEVLTLGLNRVRYAVNKLFNMSELCQYAEQLNSLTELCHKLRVTYMGEGGITFRTATDDLRDVQRWHFGRVCPVDSPEGQNIGLVGSCALFSSISSSGLIQTAFNKVFNTKLSNKFENLDCFRARNYTTLVLNKELSKKYTLCTIENMAARLFSTQVELCYSSASQLFSPAVNLIPFLGYNDPTRALMAANMQKQAVPLIKPSPPVVGTGLEHTVVHYSENNVCCVNEALVVRSDACKIVVYEYKLRSYRVYEIPEPWCTNQGSCFRARAVVRTNQTIKPGQHIIECQSSAQSEIALGANLLVAFMVWNGLNYEDSVVLSESAVAKGTLQSLHMVEHEVKLYQTTLGCERLADSFGSNARLTNRGVACVGSVLYDGDVLVGKLTPSCFSCGQLVYSDSSFRLPVGTGRATVVSVQFSTDGLDISSSKLSYCTACYNAIRKTYANRMLALAKRSVLIYYDGIDCELFCFVSNNLKIQRAINGLYNNYCKELSELIKQCFGGADAVIDSKLRASGVDANVVEIVKVKLLVHRSIQAGDKISGRHGNKGVISRVVPTADMPYMEDGTPIDLILNPLSVPSRMNLGQVFEAHLGLISYKWGLEFKHVLKLCDQTNNASVLIDLIRLKLGELYPDVDFSSWDDVSVINTARETCEGVRFACHPFVKLEEPCFKSLLKRVGFGNDASAQVKLYDGKTGAPFDRKVTVGSMYILKLNHMVDDKLHARATGPYSIVTQQPLKGKAHKGGQRLGEMEVWALQAYGVAFLLKEALTVRSDDVEGRNTINKSILCNKAVMRTTWNESFLVLIREMCSLCLNIELKVKIYRGEY